MRIVLAHPLVEADLLPVAPATLAGLAVLVVVAVAHVGPVRDAASPPRWAELQARAGPIGGPVAVALSVALVVVGWTGADAPGRNPLPVLLLGVAWPGLVAVSLLAGPVWRRLDPFDTLARLLRAPDDPHPAREPTAWAALPPALALVWFLAGNPRALQPRHLAAALVVYAVVLLAGALAFGRRSWLDRVDVVGRFLTWCGLWRRGGLAAWQPPPGAAAVLGTLGGGLLFRALRITDEWAPAVVALGGPPADVVGVLGCALAGAALLGACEAWSRGSGGSGSVAAAAVPVVAAIALAASMVRAQLVLAALLVPRVLADPLGQGWTLLGPDTPAPTVPLTAGGVAAIQACLLVAGGLAGARTVRRRRSATAAPLTAVCVLVAAGLLVTTGA